MKYIMFRKQYAPTEKGQKPLYQLVPVIFPTNMVHSVVAEAVLKTEGMERAKVRSAGELTFGFLGVTCYGHSTTLKAKAHRDDGRIINMHDVLHGL